MRNLRLRLALLALLLPAIAVGARVGSAQTKTAGRKKPGASPSAKGTAGKKNTARKTPRTAAKSGRRSRKQPGQKAPTTDRVNEIQSALAKNGSFSGTPSGKWDDETSEAMRKFQAAHGLNPTGKLDALTLQKLGLGSQTAGVAAPTPPPGAVSRLTSSIVVPAPQSESSPRP